MIWIPAFMIAACFAPLVLLVADIVLPWRTERPEGPGIFVWIAACLGVYTILACLAVRAL